jgi:HAD superfamily phosphoserine phosphatase-like hydrolase
MRYRLVAFDLDGTLANYESENSWQTIREAFDIPNLWELYLEGHLTREEAMEWEYEYWRERGATKGKLQKLFREKCKLVEGAKETINELQKGGAKIVIISEGPCMAVSHVAKKLGIHHFACNMINFDRRGHPISTVPTHPANDTRVSKALALKDFSEKFKVPLKECAVVGNDKEDTDMFAIAGFSILLNPKEEIDAPVDVVVHSESLEEVLEYL